MNPRQWESYFGIMGWSGGTFGDGAYSDGYSAGYTVSGNHAQGATVIALAGGAGQILPGTVIQIEGYLKDGVVISSVGFPVTSITVAAPGLGQLTPSGTAVEPKLPAAPSDQMAYLLAGYLADDSVLALAVGDRVERMGIEPDEDTRTLPRIYVYPGSVNQEAVARIASKDCDVVVTLVFAVAALRASEGGGVSIASVLSQIERVAMDHHQMGVRVSITETREQQLADDMTTQAYQTAALLDAKDRPFAYAQSIQFRFKNVTELSSGRIWQMRNAA